MTDLWNGLKGLARRIWHRISLPLGPAQFYTEPESDLAARLRTRDDTLGSELLVQAQETNRSQHESAESVQARAMTLQGAVAIAATLTLAVGSLVADRTKILTEPWRFVFAVLFLATVASFIAAGLRALQASSNTHRWAFPGVNDIFDHAASDLPWARAKRTASYLKCAGLNARASFKSRPDT